MLKKSKKWFSENFQEILFPQRFFVWRRLGACYTSRIIGLPFLKNRVGLRSCQSLFWERNATLHKWIKIYNPSIAWPERFLSWIFLLVIVPFLDWTHCKINEKTKKWWGNLSPVVNLSRAKRSIQEVSAQSPKKLHPFIENHFVTVIAAELHFF